ncbi:hypothetical protein K443DRAFT_110068, partial [Laccaria amethystina LaAM-08-1]
LPPDLRHGEPDEVFVNFWDGLHVWGEDLGVLGLVDQERIARPSPLHLHQFKGCTPQQVLKGGRNANAVPLMWFQAGLPCCCCDHSYEFCRREGAVPAVFEVREKVCIFCGFVQLQVVSKGGLWVCVPVQTYQHTAVKIL